MPESVRNLETCSSIFGRTKCTNGLLQEMVDLAKLAKTKLAMLGQDTSNYIHDVEYMEK